MSEPNLDDTRLIRTFYIANDWLRFAELKNGALITLNVALIGVSTNALLVTNQKLSVPILIWLSTTIILFLTSILISLSSFYARTNIFGFDISKTSEKNTTNSIYFGNIADMSTDEVIGRLCPEPSSDIYVKDVANQIIINSKLARKKFLLFNIALGTTVAGLVTPIGWLFYYWLLCDDRS